MKPHNILFILPLFLTILQPVTSFVINGIEDPNELLGNPVSFQSSLEDSLGLKLDKFEPGNQYDINGANITVGEQEILVKADEGVNYIKFGIEAVGDKAALFGGWAPVGIIDHLPDSEKIKVVGDGNVIDIEVENNNGGLTKSVKVDLNGENVINQKDEPSVVVFVEISEEEETLQITYRDGVEKIKMVKDLRTGEETFGDVEAELVGYETDRIPGYAGIEKENQASAMIKKLSAKDLKYFENARAGAIEDEEKDTIDVIVFEREVVVLQDGDVIGSLVLEDQEVLKFMDKDEETIEVVLTPEGVKGVRGDVLLSGERIESKKAKRQLEIKIKLAEDGIEVKAEADKDDIEALKEKMMKEKKVYPRDFLVRERL